MNPYYFKKVYLKKCIRIFNGYYSEVDRETEIINDLLALVKLDRKDMTLSFENTYLNKTIQDILKRLHPLAQQRNIDLIYDSRRDVYARVDEMKITLAISNLIENAIKYNKENGIVTVILDADHQNALLLYKIQELEFQQKSNIKYLIVFIESG